MSEERPEPKFSWFIPIDGDGDHIGTLRPERLPTFDYLKDVVETAETPSRAGESHPHSLKEPDMNLSAHPARIIQPQAERESNVRTGLAEDALRAPTNVWPVCRTNPCTSAVPTSPDED